MLGPCCLCPLVGRDRPDFTEAAIYRATQGQPLGEYVAGCARNACGYFGKPHGFYKWNSLTCVILVYLERIYDKGGVPVRSYPLRGKHWRD
jgi:hypothetical protein